MPAPTLSVAATEAREAAIAAFKKANDYYVEHKGADDILPPEHDEPFAVLMKAARDEDGKYVKIAGQSGDVETLKSRLAAYHEGATGTPLPWQNVTEVKGPQSWGEQFVASDGYKELAGRTTALGDGSKQHFELGVEMKAATDLIRSGAAAGGVALETPQYLPGIIPYRNIRPLPLRSLFGQADTNADVISYARQSSFDDAAAAVAEATAVTGTSGTKPQSAIGWVRETAAVTTIATWMATTRQMLSNTPATRALIDNNLRLMLEIEEEDQLINGNATPPNLRGLLATVGLQTLSLAAATPVSRRNLDGLRTAKRLVRTGVSRLNADGVVLNPVDSEEFDLLVNGDGDYRAGDPFGSGTEAPPIWRMRRVETEAIAAGTAIVGAFQAGATVYQREGVQIFTSDSHSDFFVRNLIAILAEERLGLAVFWPSAFVVVTLGAWPTS